MRGITFAFICTSLREVGRTIEETLPRPSSVVVLGCGRSGLLALTLCSDLCPNATLIGLDVSEKCLADAALLALPRLVLERVDARDPRAVATAVQRHSPEGADLVLNLVSVPDTEAGTALAARAEGIIIYFSMSVSFTRAVLSTDVRGAPLRVHLGAGVFPDQASSTLELLTRHPRLAALFAPQPVREDAAPTELRLTFACRSCCTMRQNSRKCVALRLPWDWRERAMPSCTSGAFATRSSFMLPCIALWDSPLRTLWS